MKLLDLVEPSSILASLSATDKAGAIRELVEALASGGRIDASQSESVVKSILVREKTRGTTAFGKGVAAPHTKLAGQRKVVCAVGRSATGVDFAALDGEAVFGVFLLVSPEDQPELHLQAMNIVFRTLQRDRFRKFLRQCASAQEIYELLREADAGAAAE